MMVENIDISNSLNEKRNKIFFDISKKSDIRAIKPEYHIILDVLQEISPTSRQDLLKEINEIYGCEILTYKQLYDNIKLLSNLGAVKNNELTKEVSINPEHILYHETLPISSYCIYLFSISAIFLVVSIVTQTVVNISFSIFLTGLSYLLGQHFGGKFNFRK